VGDSVVNEVVARELGELDAPADLGPFGQVALSPIRRRAARTPLVRLPGEEMCFAFNIVRFPSSADRDEASRLVARNRAIFDRLDAAGATLYPVSAIEM